MTRMRRGTARTLLLGLASVTLPACGGRDEAFEQRFSTGDPVGLTGSVALSDLSRNELMMLTSPAQGELAVKRLAVGKNIVATTASFDRKQLFVLTSGDARRLQADDESPQLFVIDGGFEPEIRQRYTLENALSKLTLDPRGDWAVVHEAEGVLVNDNELILVDLRDPEREPIKKTIRSRGGKPERLTFTEALSVPGGGAHRLLVVQTDQDVSLIDLENPEASEITVELPRTQSDQVARPAQVVFHDDVPGDSDVASYLAVRFQNDSSVLTLNLSAPSKETTENGHDFSVIPNLLDAGAVPSTIDFVITDRGLRLAALVPTQSLAQLFDPATSKSERVQFDSAYSGLARVTAFVDDPLDSGDVALLYSNTRPSIAFWRLGQASATPYASFDSYQVDSNVSQVLDVPGDDFGYLKVLLGAGGDGFFLLDLQSRLSYPMRALNGFSLRLSPDGTQAWAFAPGREEIARLTFDDRHPATFPVELAVTDVLDIARADGGRSALVLHRAFSNDDVGVTLFDAEQPDSAKTRFVSGLKLEGW